MDAGNVKYHMRVIQIGTQVPSFAESGVLIFFGGQAPIELANCAIIHDGGGLLEEVRSGDSITIDNDVFVITAVGNIVNSNLANLGHLIVKNNGKHQVEMPGEVSIEDRVLPEIRVGSTVQIVRGA